VPLSVQPTSNNIRYLRTKRDKLGHILEDVEEPGPEPHP
jgi:hypothetical protein